MKAYAAIQRSLFLLCALQCLSLPALASPESLQSMGWPLQPGENIRHVAQLIYPKNVRMQQIFIAETIKLNQEVLPELHPGTVFTFEQQITIPSIKQLSTRSRAGVKRND